MMQNETTLGGTKRFPQTRWSVLLSVTDAASPKYRENLNYLVSIYWKPVYAYIRRSWNKSNEDAKDLTQGYFMNLLDYESFTKLTASKGRFRSFIKASLKNYLSQEEGFNSRQKRGGDCVQLSIDFGAADELIIPAQDSDPEEIFDTEWKQALVARSLEILKEDLAKSGKINYYEIFHEFYYSDSESLSYDQIALKYNVSRFDVGNYLKAARSMFRKIVLTMIADYVSDGNEIDQEFRFLFESE